MAVEFITMMSALPVVAVVGGVIYKAASKYKEENREYYIKDSPEGASTYKVQKTKGAPKKMTVQERLDLSWQFLYDITNSILNKFSSEDQMKVLDLGRVLLKYGGIYHHVIDYGIRSEAKVMDKKQGGSGGGISLSN